MFTTMIIQYPVFLGSPKKHSSQNRNAHVNLTCSCLTIATQHNQYCVVNDTPHQRVITRNKIKSLTISCLLFILPMAQDL